MRRFTICLLLPCFALLRAASLQGQDAPNSAAEAPAAEQALLEDLPVVQAAALHQQTLQEAPANVTVISAADIHKYGYRTLGEALASVRGFYLTYDRIYHYLGVAGFSLPGDFNTRLLIMINGHSMTEHVYDSNNFFGQDFGLDMDLVERIEILRGSASALYGSNAMLATINVITRSPVDAPGFRASAELGSFGEKKAFFSDSVYLGKGANLIVSGSAFLNAGQTLFIPQFDSPLTNDGILRNGDGEQGYHSFAELIWHEWTFTAYFNSRRKQVPVNWADDTVFGDGGSYTIDSRNFLELARSQDVGKSGKLSYRFYYDSYRYNDRFDYNFGYIEDQRSRSRNEWIGSEITYSHPDTNRGVLTIGAQAEFDFRNLQQEWEVNPTPQLLVNFNVPDRTAALFGQQEWQFSRRWKAQAGLRFDQSRNYGYAASPRVALVYQATPKTVLKAVYGRPFRNPSAYEKYFSDNETLAANLNLQPERADTYELSAEHQFAHNLNAILNVYEFRTHGLIQEVFSTDPSVIPSFQNVDAVNSQGIELEISKKFPGDLEILTSTAFQKALDHGTGERLPNSPGATVKFRAGRPIVRNRVFAATSLQYMAARSTDSNSLLGPVFLQDFTLTSRKPVFTGFDLQLGVRNLWNRTYSDPVGLAVDTIQQDGRSVFLKLIWRGAQ